MTYAADSIKEAIDNDRERLFAAYSVGRPTTWAVDVRTKDTVCIGNWLAEELARVGVSDVDRRTQQWRFNRESRSAFDLFEVAAQIMNDTLAGDIEQNRRYHKRWG